MSHPCKHLEDIQLDPMPSGGCIECLKTGDSWVHLRFCVTCKQTRCCDDSKNQHSRKHWLNDGHGVIRSKEPGEYWAWCYIDEVGISTEQS